MFFVLSGHIGFYSVSLVVFMLRRTLDMGGGEDGALQALSGSLGP